MKIKHIFVTLLLLAGFQFAANAQFLLGGGVGYGTEVEAISIQPRAVYTITGPWRAGADFNLYLDGDEGVSYWDLNLNGHYVFHDTEGFKAYALAGINFLHVKVDFGLVEGSDTETGLNIGAGAQLPIGPLNGLLEARYVIGDADQLVISATVLFPLGGN